MRVKRLLREAYWGDEFLVEEDGEDRVLRIVNVPLDRYFFFNEYSKLKRLRVPNVLIPEKIKISDGKYLFFYPYYQSLKPLEVLSEEVSGQILRLFTFLSKAGVIVPVLGLDDFCWAVVWYSFPRSSVTFRIGQKKWCFPSKRPLRQPERYAISF